MNICVVSGGDEIRLRSYINQYIYCREHYLDYRLECGLDTEIRTKFDYKTSIVRRLLRSYDWLVWVDNDAYFTDFDSNNIRTLIEDAEREGNFLVIAEGAREPTGFWSRINTGVFAIKNCPEGELLLLSMHQTPIAKVEKWWSAERDGFFTRGDQDQMWYILNTSGLVEKTTILPHRQLNSRKHHYVASPKDAFIVHFCRCPSKELEVMQFGRRFGLGRDLVPTELLDKYSSTASYPISPARYLYMSAKQGLAARIRGYFGQYQQKNRVIPNE